MKRVLVFAFLATTTCWAANGDSGDTNSLFVSFNNGVELRIKSQITADRVESVVRGSIATMPPESVHRLFIDQQHKLRFGYDVEIKSDFSAAGVTISIEPLQTSVAESLPSPSTPIYGGKISTFLESQQFGPLQIGESALVNLPGGAFPDQRVTDVITVVKLPNRREGYRSLTPPHVSNSMFHVAGLKVFVNGKDVTGVQSPVNIAGRFLSLYIPGRGAYMLSLEPRTGMNESGQTHGGELVIRDGIDTIVCRSEQPILGTEGSARIWVAHKPHYRPVPWKFNGVVANPHPEMDIEISASDSPVL